MLFIVVITIDGYLQVHFHLGSAGFSMGQIRGTSTCRFSNPSHTLNIIRHYSSTIFIVVNLKL